ncbi:MAG: nicotinate (nicotinamide) nucleotide adenylyltransferase, partial [Bacteroidaceae bacterium]
FNPIHIGHTALANWVVEQGYVDEIWFVVSPLNPLKEAANLLDAHTRLKLVQLAIGDYSKFKVCTIEFELAQPNYMYRTLEVLQQQNPTINFQLLIGLDNWLDFSKWKKATQIMANYPILVYPRPGYSIGESLFPSSVSYLCDMPVMDISSSMICQALNEGKNMQFFLSPRILESMKELFPALKN